MSGSGTDDKWERLKKRPMSEQDVAAIADRDFSDLDAAQANPFAMAMTFIQGLQDRTEFLPALEAVTTPESRAAWGDFAEAAAALDSIEDWGIGSMPSRAEGASDVAYAVVLRSVGQGFQSLDEQVVDAAAIITLVWRPEFGRWLVHAFGHYVSPDELPRSSPNVAP